MTARGKDYAYADRALVRLAARETRHFDFLEISSMDATDCEFIDGFHAGDVVAARMLKAMVKAQDNGLADFVDGPDIERIIKDFPVTRLPTADIKAPMSGKSISSNSAAPRIGDRPLGYDLSVVPLDGKKPQTYQGLGDSTCIIISPMAAGSRDRKSKQFGQISTRAFPHLTAHGLGEAVLNIDEA